MVIFRRIGKHYLCSEDSDHRNSPNITTIGVAAGPGENPKWHVWLQKCHFGKGPRNGFYYL